MLKPEVNRWSDLDLAVELTRTETDIERARVRNQQQAEELAAQSRRFRNFLDWYLETLKLLLLICGFAGNERFSGFDTPSTIRRRFLREIHQNISFAILVSIAIVVVALVGLFEIKYHQKPGQPLQSNPIITVLLSILLVNFVLTRLMVLKRTHAVLSNEFSGPRSVSKNDKAA
jgi:hypothetical protein